jgi:hypothetical protein
MAQAKGDGPDASTNVGGRTLFNNGSEMTETDDAGTTKQVGAINGGTLSTAAANKEDPSVRISNGAAGQITEIFNAVMRARRLLDAGLAAASGGDTLSEKAMIALQDNFHNVDRSTSPPTVRKLYEIRESLAKTRAAFSGEIPIAVDMLDEKDGTLGYVTDYWIFGNSDIHLLPRWFRQGPEGQARIIVHEACHKYDNDDDHAYRYWGSSDDFANMSIADAIDNADSYAYFCTDVV